MRYTQVVFEDKNGNPIMPVTTDDSVISKDGKSFKDTYAAKDDVYDKEFINQWDTLVVTGTEEDGTQVEERDISYSAIPLYCGKWVDGSDIHRRVYVVTSGIAKDNTIKVADKPANMKLLIRGFAIIEGTNAVEHTMTNSDSKVWVKDSGVFATNNFTGYAERMYIVLEYTVEGEPI